MMSDYSNLCQLPFDEMLSHLTVKEQIKCKAVCSGWKYEVERWERSRKSLVFHLHAFLPNVKWTNDESLMRLENSFQIRSLDFLRRPFTQNHFKKLKKVAILDMHLSYLFGNKHQRFGQCINWLVECEELELSNLYLEGKTTFDFPKLKVLVLRKVDADRLEIKCPVLEILVLQSKVKQIEFKSTKSLKYWATTNMGALNFRSSTPKFSSLECLNLFNNGFLSPVFERELSQIREDLLRYTPKLKKLICYPTTAQLSFDQWQAQKTRFGLKDLQILMAGFKEAKFNVVQNESQFMITIDTIDAIFDNYPNLVEPCPWGVHIDYYEVARHFRILPSTFFTRFPNVISFEIKRVTNYRHLFGFLKHCPRLIFLQISLCRIEPGFLDHLSFLTPSVRVLAFKYVEPNMLLDFDFLFLCNLNLQICKFFSSVLPIQIIEKVLKHSKSLINLKYGTVFGDMNGISYDLNIYVKENRLYLKHQQMGQTEELAFRTFDQLASRLNLSAMARPYLFASN